MLIFSGSKELGRDLVEMNVSDYYAQECDSSSFVMVLKDELTRDPRMLRQYVAKLLKARDTRFYKKNIPACLVYELGTGACQGAAVFLNEGAAEQALVGGGWTSKRCSKASLHALQAIKRETAATGSRIIIATSSLTIQIYKITINQQPRQTPHLTPDQREKVRIMG